MVRSLHRLEGDKGIVEIKLTTMLAGENREMVIDEHGVLWKYSCPGAVHGILSATTKGIDGEAIQGFYQNGTLFIVNLSDARKYFRSITGGTRTGRRAYEHLRFRLKSRSGRMTSDSENEREQLL